MQLSTKRLRSAVLLLFPANAPLAEGVNLEAFFADLGRGRSSYRVRRVVRIERIEQTSRQSNDRFFPDSKKKNKTKQKTWSNRRWRADTLEADQAEYCKVVVVNVH